MSQIVVILIVANVLASLKGFNDVSFFNRYKFQVSSILNGDKVRMFTSGFLHADWIHLGFNMYALYLFGRIVSASFGSVYFLLIYFGSLLAGSMYSLFVHKREGYYSAVGASGAVTGIVFSAILVYPEMELIMFPIPLPLPGYVFAVGYLLYSIYGMKNQSDNIGHAAHIGGAIGGYALTLLLSPVIVRTDTILVLVIGGIIGALLLFGDKILKR
ncbi:rhomboid family intramembrane serine protease [Tenacibaculum geojense]|uniref:Rhomboid family intramembrane serine protease n=1 Tax=Tenacibaculum geojense TaxID=915352 RepID=A0ABW3JNI8_9FLAO